MSTFEESPLTGPLPPGSLPTPTPPTPLVPHQPPSPGPSPTDGSSLVLRPRLLPDDSSSGGHAEAPLGAPRRELVDTEVVDGELIDGELADADFVSTDFVDAELIDAVPLGDVSPDPEVGPTLRSRRLVAGLLAGTLLLGAVLAGALVYERRVQAQDQAVEAARSQAVAVVRLAAPLLLSYDYRTLAADFAAALAYTDGEFKKQYQQTTSTVVSPVAAQYKAVVRAQLVEVGVTSATADQVVLVAFVNQVTTSTRVTGTKLDQSRVRFELRRTGTAWKIVQVAAL